jgi:putative nucleotidyltransferase with HDIG domain
MRFRLINKIRDQHEFIFKLLLFICAIVLVVFLFPREAKFKYEFQKNSAWAHQDLTAPFDFAILKSPQEIDEEKQQLQQSHLLYFVRNTEAEKNSTDLFIDELKSRKSSSFEAYKNIGLKLLEQVYNIGVYNSSSKLNNINKKQPVLLLNEKNIGEELELSDLLSTSTAKDFIANELASLNFNDTLLSSVLLEAVTENLTFDENLTNDHLTSELNNISSTRGGVLNGQKIISTGELITEDKFLVLQSLKNEYENKIGGKDKTWLILIGQLIIVSILFYSLFIFLKNVSTEVYHDNKNIAFIMLIMLGFLALTILVIKFSSFSVYLIPFCAIPILFRTFFGNRIALFVFVITTFIISFVVPNSFEFILIEIIAGIATLYTILNVNKRSELFFTALIIFISFSVIYIGFSFIHEGSITKINWSNLKWFGISAGLTLFTYPLIYLFEKMFGYISDVTLLELSDTNNKLLRELNLKAPGTFQHSLQVANLAEEAIREIGGNALLVRTGALYHDIGKMINPAYFIENQSSGINPHDDLNYEESASIIINHVLLGIELAKKHQLPEQLIDFIRTHHGTTKTQYFLRMFAIDNPELNIEDDIFQYPGPIPFSKETAVLMMADGVEAASRSLKVYSLETITTLVNTIIDSQVKENQFINTDITFKHITVVKRLFIKKLTNIYHVRVEYPK